MILVSVGGSAVGLCPPVLDLLMAVLYNREGVPMEGRGTLGSRGLGDGCLMETRTDTTARRAVFWADSPFSSCFLSMYLSVLCSAFITRTFSEALPCLWLSFTAGDCIYRGEKRGLWYSQQIWMHLDAQEWFAPALSTCWYPSKGFSMAPLGRMPLNFCPDFSIHRATTALSS